MKLQFAAAVIAVAFMSQAHAGPLFGQAAYAADTTFRDVLGSTTMTMAYDGTSYWSASGGGTSGTRLARYDGAGNSTGTFAPGLDFRSVFTNATNEVLARQYFDRTIYKQTAPGTFSSQLTLTGGVLDEQSSVVMNGNGQFVAMIGGQVDVWDATGVHINAFALNGYTGSYPESRGIAAAGTYLFTYFSQTLKAWDYSGNEVDSTTLTDAGSDFDSHFSISYANDRFFVVDDAGRTWRGYDVGLGGGTVPVPEPGALALVGLALAGLALARRRRARQITPGPRIAPGEASSQLQAALVIMAEGGLTVLEHSSRDEPPPTPPGLALERTKKYGETALAFYRRG